MHTDDGGRPAPRHPPNWLSGRRSHLSGIAAGAPGPETSRDVSQLRIRKAASYVCGSRPDQDPELPSGQSRPTSPPRHAEVGREGLHPSGPPPGPLLFFLDLTHAAPVPRFERDAGTSPDCPPRRREADPGMPALSPPDGREPGSRGAPRDRAAVPPAVGPGLSPRCRPGPPGGGPPRRAGAPRPRASPARGRARRAGRRRAPWPRPGARRSPSARSARGARRGARSSRFGS